MAGSYKISVSAHLNFYLAMKGKLKRNKRVQKSNPLLKKNLKEGQVLRNEQRERFPRYKRYDVISSTL